MNKWSSDMTTAILTWSCVAVCPECCHDNDLAHGERYDEEKDRHFSSIVFRGDWEKAAGFAVECEFCHQQFKLSRIESEHEPQA